MSEYFINQKKSPIIVSVGYKLRKNTENLITGTIVSKDYLEESAITSPFALSYTSRDDTSIITFSDVVITEEESGSASYVIYSFIAKKYKIESNKVKID